MCRKFFCSGRTIIVVLLTALAVFAMASWASAGESSRRASGMHTQTGRHAPAWLRDAVRAWDQGKKSKAVFYARRALRRQHLASGERAIAVHMLCVGQTELGKADKALYYCDEAVRVEREQKWLHHNNRANARLQLGDVEGAMQDYQQSLALMKFDRSGRLDEMVDGQSYQSIVQANIGRAQQSMGSRVESIAAATPAPTPVSFSTASESAAVPVDGSTDVEVAAEEAEPESFPTAPASPMP